MYDQSGVVKPDKENMARSVISKTEHRLHETTDNALDNASGSVETVRSRRLTSKGLEYQIERKKTKCRRARKNLNSQSNTIKSMFIESVSMSEKKSYHSHWLSLYEALLDSHEDLTEWGKYQRRNKMVHRSGRLGQII